MDHTDKDLDAHTGVGLSRHGWLCTSKVPSATVLARPGRAVELVCPLLSPAEPEGSKDEPWDSRGEGISGSGQGCRQSVLTTSRDGGTWKISCTLLCDIAVVTKGEFLRGSVECSLWTQTAGSEPVPGIWGHRTVCMDQPAGSSSEPHMGSPRA